MKKEMLVVILLAATVITGCEIPQQTTTPTQATVVTPAPTPIPVAAPQREITPCEQEYIRDVAKQMLDQILLEMEGMNVKVNIIEKDYIEMKSK
jgi:hypothetical protein